MSGFITLPLAAVTESTFNPRRHFDPAKLAELAENIKASGVHQPILVRPLPGARVPDTAKGVTHEIVAGARRFRASQLAGMAAIPADALIRATGITREALAKKIGRSPSYVHASLKLLDLCPEARAALEATGCPRSPRPARRCPMTAAQLDILRHSLGLRAAGGWVLIKGE